MQKVLEHQNEESRKTLIPIIMSDGTRLKSSIAMQKHDNAQLQKQIDALVVDKNIMQEQIMAFYARIQELEEHVGD